MIPKKVHFCWFGGKELPKLERDCIEACKVFLPDYEIIIWGDDNFDFRSNQFASEAYDDGSYAFVSDYARVAILYEYGGIYLDTDYEIVQDISHILNSRNLVLGYETSKFVGTAFMACSPNNKLIKKFKEKYDRPFFDHKGRRNISANPSLLLECLNELGFDLDGKSYEGEDALILERDILFPKKLQDQNFLTTDRTLGIHHFSGSWLTPRQKRIGSNVFWIEIMRPSLLFIKRFLHSILPDSIVRNIEVIIRNFLR